MDRQTTSLEAELELKERHTLPLYSCCISHNLGYISLHGPHLHKHVFADIEQAQKSFHCMLSLHAAR